MIRKIVALSLTFLLMVGTVFAKELQAIFQKFEDGKVTVTVDDKEKTYPLYKQAIVKLGKKNEQPASTWLKTAKKGTAMLIAVDEDTITEITIEKRKKK
jgi:hypothetical protein